MRTFELIIAFYLLVLGFAIIITWTLLLTGGAVPNIERDLFSLIFHWSSESFLAFLSIAIGIGVLRFSELARKALFFDFGMAVCSALNALYYYTAIEYSAGMSILFSALTVFSLVFLIIAYQSYRFMSLPHQGMLKFGLFNLGLFAYQGLNIAGEYGQKGNWVVFSMLVFLIIVALSILLRMVRSGTRTETLQIVVPEK